MSLGHEYGLVLIGLAGPMEVVNISLSLSLSCGTRTRSLFGFSWWPMFSANRPRPHNRFVLKGLCWLYGRSEFLLLWQDIWL